MSAEDPYDSVVVVRTWFGQARFGQAREIIAWLHDEVLPGARAADGCLGAEAFAEDGDGHEVMVLTRWASVDDADGWAVGEHPALRSSDESAWMTVEDAQRVIALNR